MKISAQEPGMILSVALHAGLLAFGLIALSSARPFDEFAEAVPVDVISDAQFRELTRGDQKEKQVRPDTPVRVDRVAKVEEQKDPGQDKKDVPTPPPPPLRPVVKEALEDVDEDKPAPAPPKVAVLPPPPPARPEPVKAQPPKPQPAKDEDEEDKEAEIIRQRQLRQKQEREKAEEARRLEEKLKADRAAEAQRKAADAKAQAEARAQDEARALAAEAKKAEDVRKAEEAKKAAEARRILDENNKKSAEAARKVAEARKADDARKAAEKAESDKLQAAIRNRLLASREAPASSGATGQQVTRTASAGAPNATGKRLSPSDRDYLMGVIKEQMERCWSVSGMSNPQVKPVVRLQLSPSGAITVQPALVNSASDPAFRAIAESGMRAIRACAPYRIPPRFADTFEDWKTVTVKLDPSDLL